METSGDPDGCFGEGTESAVRAFQRNAGLLVDGVVGPATWAALGQAALYEGIRTTATKSRVR